MKHVVICERRRNERRIIICNVRTFGRRINDNVVRKEEAMTFSTMTMLVIGVAVICVLKDWNNSHKDK